MNSIYFDHASTTKLSDEVFQEMMPYLLENYQNPSSLYDDAIKNKKVINTCRGKVAQFINANPKEIYFCSGGSEANNWALKGVAFASKEKKEIITSKIEHHAITHTCEFLERIGYTVKYLDVDNYGFININQLKDYISDRTLIVTIMMANNEIGTIQNIKEIGMICKEKGVLFHTDAVQAICHTPIDVKELGIDMMSISAHKFYGPKGIGCLYIRNGVEIENLIHGGKQENGKRSGTENVASIVGLAKAMELEMKEMDKHASKQRNLAKMFIDNIKNEINDVKINGPEIGENRLPGNLNLSFKDVDGSILIYLLNKKGIYVSSGSACNSGAIEPSHVLKAINVADDYINGSVRITLGKDTTEEEISILSEAIIDIVKNKKA